MTFTCSFVDEYLMIMVHSQFLHNYNILNQWNRANGGANASFD